MTSYDLHVLHSYLFGICQLASMSGPGMGLAVWRIQGSSGAGVGHPIECVCIPTGKPQPTLDVNNSVSSSPENTARNLMQLSLRCHRVQVQDAVKRAGRWHCGCGRAALAATYESLRMDLDLSAEADSLSPAPSHPRARRTIPHGAGLGSPQFNANCRLGAFNRRRRRR